MEDQYEEDKIEKEATQQNKQEKEGQHLKEQKKRQAQKNKKKKAKEKIEYAQKVDQTSKHDEILTNSPDVVARPQKNQQTHTNQKNIISKTKPQPIQKQTNNQNQPPQIQNTYTKQTLSHPNPSNSKQTQQHRTEKYQSDDSNPDASTEEEQDTEEEESSAEDDYESVQSSDSEEETYDKPTINFNPASNIELDQAFGEITKHMNVSPRGPQSNRDGRGGGRKSQPQTTRAQSKDPKPKHSQ
ncbi:uncharacterized protein LOC132637286 [Lycium barbarum]|uniref:uncharacterized protein LOC132637286 n=1 Tax=Lycium barbarum TaxID=112863 RepID=UPI00293E3D0C|nr:uncharacterized protein LOC132637286 [Lycium barbarum]